LNTLLFRQTVASLHSICTDRDPIILHIVYRVNNPSQK